MEDNKKYPLKKTNSLSTFESFDQPQLNRTMGVKR